MKQQLCDVDLESGHFHFSRTLGQLVFPSFSSGNCEVNLCHPEQEKNRHSLRDLYKGFLQNQQDI